MQAAGQSAGTIKIRMYYLRRFEEVCKVNPAAVTREELVEWLASMTWAPETRRSARSSLRMFYYWAQGVGLVAVSPAARLPRVRCPIGVPHPASDEAIADALAAADDRTRLMILLGAIGGLRRAEISTVHRDRLDGRELYVLGKGGKTRTIRLPGDIAAQVRRAGRQNGWVFSNGFGSHLSADRVGALISDVLPAGITPHHLRHAAASYLFNECDLDILEIKEFLGHADISTTQRYVKNNRDRTGEAIDRAARRFAA